MSDVPLTLPLLAVRWLTPACYELTLARQDLAFTPGDCLALHGPNGESRPYSIASGPEEPTLRLLVRWVPGGCLSDTLWRLPIGHALPVSPPFGWFRPAAGAWPRVFLATSTGIAPFLSAALTPDCPPPTVCVLGIRARAEAVLAGDLGQRWPLRLALSRQVPPLGPGEFAGRLTALLPTLLGSPETHYYLCGLDTMIADASQYLLAHGVPATHLHREVFFHAPAP